MHQFALFAGSAAAAIFMISQLPMLIKAGRTKDLTSYSFANIGLANVGNVLVRGVRLPGARRAGMGHPRLQSDDVRADALLVPALRLALTGDGSSRCPERTNESSGLGSANDAGPRDADDEVRTKCCKRNEPRREMTTR